MSCKKPNEDDMAIHGRIFVVQKQDLCDKSKRSAFLSVASWTVCLFAEGVDLLHGFSKG